MYRTICVRIKKGHRLYSYFDDLARKSTNLYNVTNFFIRQVFTGIPKDPSARHKNESDVINTVNACVQHHPKFDQITPENPSVTYGMLDYVFKNTKNVDYYALPSHTNQHSMMEVFEAWKAYHISIQEYQHNPEKYTGRPGLPNYTKKGSRKTITFTNQTCVIKEEKYLKFPKTKERVNLGKMGSIGRLQEVRVSPSREHFTVQIVHCIDNKSDIKYNPDNIIGIDLGVNNFATITNNIGLQPLIINGRGIKSINQYYNKKRGYYSENKCYQ